MLLCLSPFACGSEAAAPVLTARADLTRERHILPQAVLHLLLSLL